VGDRLRNLDEEAEAGRLAGLLCQLPQSFHHGKQNLAWLARLARALEGLRPAVEFRHRSWARPEVVPWLSEQGLDLVAVDVPNLPGLYPRGWAQAAGRAYVRLHSRNAGNWYGGDKARYDYLYPDAELEEWVEAALANAGHTEEALFLFNNCHDGQAPRNARRLAELFALRAPHVEVVAPFGEVSPVQRSLFE
jgi:uncharacterized protein YecE (DUF72 family)